MLKTKLARRAALASAMALGAGLIPTTAGAHPEGDAHHAPLPSHATNVMRAFADDHHGNENLSALSTTSCVGGFAGEVRDPGEHDTHDDADRSHREQDLLPTPEGAPAARFALFRGWVGHRRVHAVT